jgi:hypothetical protein
VFEYRSWQGVFDTKLCNIQFVSDFLGQT